MTKLKSLLLLFAVVVYSLPNMAQTATLNTDKKYQYIRGFGGINHPTWCGDLTEAQCNTAFGNGDGQLGFSILRIWVDSDSQNWSKEIATAKRAANHGARPEFQRGAGFKRNGVCNRHAVGHGKRRPAS